VSIEVLSDLISKATVGALLLGAIYHSSLYYFRRNDLLGTYAVYLWCCFFYMTWRVYSGANVQKLPAHFFINSLLLVLSFQLYFYFFVEKVFQLHRKTKAICRFYQSSYVISALHLITLALLFLNGNPISKAAVINISIVSACYMFYGVYAIVLAWNNRKSAVEICIVWGAIALLVFNLAGFLSQFAHEDVSKTHFLNFICLGIFSEIILFSTAVGLQMKEELLAQVTAEKNILRQQKLLLESENEKNMEVLKAKISERKKISMDMHDELSNSLVGLKFYVNELKRNAGSEQERELAQKIEKEVKLVYEQARIFMHELYAGTTRQWFNYIGFLNTLPSRFSDSSLAITVHMNEEEVKHFFSRTTENYIYLITKECLSNIMKYARASLVKINVLVKDQMLYLSITDNGIGMAGTEKIGMGHQNIEERVKELHGKMNIDSTPAGTTISLAIPAWQSEPGMA
jgi:signal transduction histidine kinase